jgi:hypothetical protein
MVPPCPDGRACLNTFYGGLFYYRLDALRTQQVLLARPSAETGRCATSGGWLTWRSCTQESRAGYGWPLLAVVPVDTTSEPHLTEGVLITPVLREGATGSEAGSRTGPRLRGALWENL